MPRRLATVVRGKGVRGIIFLDSQMRLTSDGWEHSPSPFPLPYRTSAAAGNTSHSGTGLSPVSPIGIRVFAKG